MIDDRKMIPVDDIPDDIDQLEEQVDIRQKLRQIMVGQLYQSIVVGEICQINGRISDLRRN
jgi:hypothetical protein